MHKFLLSAFLFFMIGFLRYLSVVPRIDPSWVSYYNESGKVTLVGQVLKVDVTSEVLKLVVGRLQLRDSFPDRINRHSIDGRILRGQLLVRTRRFPQYNYGDLLEIEGELQTPSGEKGVSYQEYLAIDGIYSLLNFPEISLLERNQGNPFLSLVFKLRNNIETVVNQLIDEPRASLLVGIVFGIRRDFETTFYEALRKTGVLHVVVASGFNILVVMGFLSPTTYFLGKKASLLIIVMGILVYVALVGFEAPIVRAAIMGGGSLLATVVGRQKHGLLWLQLAALLMLFYNPFLYKSLSFQLSFVASLGMILFASPLKTRFLFLLPDFLASAASTTLAVQVFALPLIWFSFGEIHLISLLVNTLVLGVIPLVMNFGILAVGVSFWNLNFARVLILPAWVLLSYFIKVVEIFGS